MRGAWLAFAIVLGMPATAQAAQARVWWSGATTYDVQYDASAGETNDIEVLAREPRSLRINDAGAPWVNGFNGSGLDALACTTERFGTTCTPTIGLLHPLIAGLNTKTPQTLHLTLGDGDDRAIVRAPNSSLISDGPGDDNITLLRDGGITAGPGADVMSGSISRQYVSYFERLGPVSVTLDGVANDGEAGEHDNVMPTFDGMSGTTGADVLIGNDDSNLLHGQGGADHIEGHGGTDFVDATPDAHVDGGTGNDHITVKNTPTGPDGGVVYGGEGDDRIWARLSTNPFKSTTIHCGPGHDTVSADPTDVVGADCEVVSFD